MSDELAELLIVLILFTITAFILIIFFDPTTRGAVVTYIIGIHDMFTNSGLGT